MKGWECKPSEDKTVVIDIKNLGYNPFIIRYE